jgi:hypothetical protein
MAGNGYTTLVKCVVLLGCKLEVGTFSFVGGAEAGELLCSRDREGSFWGPPGKVVYQTKTVKAGTKLTEECLGIGTLTIEALPALQGACRRFVDVDASDLVA